VIRIVIAVAVFIVPHIVTTVTTLVEKGPQAQALEQQYSAQIATAQQLDPVTSAALAKNPNDQAAGVKALSELTGISPTDIVTVVGAAAAEKSGATVPPAQLALLKKDGPAIQAATAKLQAVGKVPPADFALLQNVGNAAHDSPRQWQHYFWIAVGGQIVFIPLIFLMAGYWSPRRAREKEREHEAMVDAELAKLTA
jgi:hypothetical protein